jgi:MFS transporter, OFA family, oxalate/formate antiporter
MRTSSGCSNTVRVKVAAAGFGMQLALGAVYGWSVLLTPLQQHFGASKVATNLTFTITLAVLGITAGFGGALLRHAGPRATATLAGLLYGAGVLLSGFAPSLTVLYLTYGLLGGIGLGLGYIVPLAALIAWFPDRRGFITGLAVAGFGLGALIMSPLAAMLIGAYGVQSALVILGVAYLAMVLAAAPFLQAAPENYSPPGWTGAAAAGGAERAFTLGRALRTPHWYLLWAMLALNVTAGAALISVAAPLVQELTLAGPALGTLAVCLIALCNGAGRLFWGALSDALGRAGTFLTLFLLQALAFALLPGLAHVATVLIAVCVIALCYGGGFGTMPAFASDVFGARNAGTIYGAMLTAWSAGAVAGPLLIAAVPYRTALPLIAAMLAVAAILPVVFGSLARRGEMAPAGLPVLRDRSSGVAT